MHDVGTKSMRMSIDLSPHLVALHDETLMDIDNTALYFLRAINAYCFNMDTEQGDLYLFESICDKLIDKGIHNAYTVAQDYITKLQRYIIGNYYNLVAEFSSLFEFINNVWIVNFTVDVQYNGITLIGITWQNI